MRPKILLIDDERCFLDAVRYALEGEDIEVHACQDAGQAVLKFKENPRLYSAVVIDYHLGELKGDEIAGVLRKINPDQFIIFATGDFTSETMLRLLNAGPALRFIAKGGGPDSILNPIRHVVSKFQNEKRLIGIEKTSQDKISQDLSQISMAGRSEALHEVYKRVQKLRQIGADVLIIGESGTGKELIAKALCRQGEKLFSVNCASYSGDDRSIEAELFGSVKGAYTDAVDKRGLLEEASDHVVFLDEFHELGPSAQARLLRVLQDKKLRRLGDSSGREIQTSFRLLVGTKPLIFDLVDSEEFKPDLFYRVSKHQIEIAPLRARPEDVEPLVEFACKQYRRKTGKSRYFNAASVAVLASYKWPGNARELLSFTESLLEVSEKEILEVADVLTHITKRRDRRKEFPQQTPEVSELDLKNDRRRFEFERISEALRLHRSIRKAARALGMSYSSLHYKIKELGIRFQFAKTTI